MFGRKKEALIMTTTDLNVPYTILGVVDSGGFTVGMARKAVEIKAQNLGADAVIGLQVSTGLGGIRVTGTAVRFV